mmetsp:Transcript_25824/g.36520  ORF Transcript_25824/g.36520 Transcript_25824/m.36520 type:complete len:102 (-) Transcript_25824:34-339(-)
MPNLERQKSLQRLAPQMATSATKGTAKRAKPRKADDVTAKDKNDSSNSSDSDNEWVRDYDPYWCRDGCVQWDEGGKIYYYGCKNSDKETVFYLKYVVDPNE